MPTAAVGVWPSAYCLVDIGPFAVGVGYADGFAVGVDSVGILFSEIIISKKKSFFFLIICSKFFFNFEFSNFFFQISNFPLSHTLNLRSKYLP